VASSAPAPGLPRSAKTIGIPLAAVVLVLSFIYLGFPYDRLADYMEAELGRDRGVRLAIRALGPRLQLAGPGLEAAGVDARWDDGRELQLDRALLRPAWSLSWLTGSPAIHLRLMGPAGEAEGTLTLDGAGAWDGELRQADLTALPISGLWPGLEAEGSVDASVDLHLREGGPEGAISFEARDGLLTLTGSGITLPYERIEGELEFGGDAFARVKLLRLEGPAVTAEVTGALGKAQRFASAPLALTARLDLSPPIRTLFQSAGIRVSRDGTARIRISGTPGRPAVR
jgi:type II secretion system protein N